MIHPLTRSIDLIAWQYGWTDDYILDRTLGRLRLATDAIVERVTADQRRQIHLAEIHAKAIIGGLPAIASAKGASKSITRYLKSLRFLGGDDDEAEKPLPTPEQIGRGFGKRR